MRAGFSPAPLFNEPAREAKLPCHPEPATPSFPPCRHGVQPAGSVPRSIVPLPSCSHDCKETNFSFQKAKAHLSHDLEHAARLGRVQPPHHLAHGRECAHPHRSHGGVQAQRLRARGEGRASQCQQATLVTARDGLLCNAAKGLGGLEAWRGRGECTAAGVPLAAASPPPPPPACHPCYLLALHPPCNQAQQAARGSLGAGASAERGRRSAEREVKECRKGVKQRTCTAGRTWPLSPS